MQDLLGALYYQEILKAAAPGAVVLLTVRDQRAWWRSYNTLNAAVRVHGILCCCSRMPAVAKLYPLWVAAMVAFFGARCSGDGRDMEAHLELVSRHEERVRAAVPAGRLLVFDVKQGWEPLVSFLDANGVRHASGARLTVPMQPFPHLNEGSGVFLWLWNLVWHRHRADIALRVASALGWLYFFPGPTSVVILLVLLRILIR